MIGLRDVRARLGQFQRLILSLILALGAILVLVAALVGGAVGEGLRELGFVTVGTVAVTLIYDSVLRPVQDAHLLKVVRDSLIGRAGPYGLAGIDRVNFRDLFRGLDKNDELLWLDTYCPDMESAEVQDALCAAIDRGAAVHMLVMDPDAATADLRAHEIATPGQHDPEEFRTNAQRNLNILEHLRDTRLDENKRCRLRFDKYWGLPCAPMYLVARQSKKGTAKGQLVEGWTSYFLTLPTYQSAHLHWDQAARADRLPAGAGMGLEAFRTYFSRKLEDVRNGGGEGSGLPSRLLDRWDDSRVEAALRQAEPGTRIRILETWLPGIETLAPKLIDKEKRFKLQVLLMSPGPRVASDGSIDLLNARIQHREDVDRAPARHEIIKTISVLRSRNKEVGSASELEIKVYTFLPFGPLYEIGDRLFAGVYPVDRPSERGPMLLIDRAPRRPPTEMWSLFDTQFNTGWNAAKTVTGCDLSTESVTYAGL